MMMQDAGASPRRTGPGEGAAAAGRLVQWLLDYSARLRDVKARAAAYSSALYIERGLPLLCAALRKFPQVCALGCPSLMHMPLPAAPALAWAPGFKPFGTHARRRLEGQAVAVARLTGPAAVAVAVAVTPRCVVPVW